jgi:hypothetical protein
MKKILMFSMLLFVSLMACKKPQTQVAPVPVPGAQAPAELPTNGSQPTAAPLPNSTATQQQVQPPAPLPNATATNQQVQPPAPVAHSTEGQPTDGSTIGLVQLGDEKPATASKGKKGGKKTAQPTPPAQQQQVRTYIPPTVQPETYSTGRWTAQVSSHGEYNAAVEAAGPGQMPLPNAKGGWTVCEGRFSSKDEAIRYISSKWGKKKKKQKNYPFPRQF